MTVLRDIKLPTKPQYVRVELDVDMALQGPMRNGNWPGRRRVLYYHYFGKQPLRRGDRVCVNAGRYRDCFGTVIGKSRWRWSGYTYGVRRVRTKRVTFTVPVEKTAEFEVA